MDKYKFLNALSNNECLDKLDVQQLNEVVESFPYFQSAYLLLAQKIIHQPQPTTDTSVTLPCIAAHIGDREMLYKLWNPSEYALKQGAFSDEAYTQINEDAKKATREPVLFPETLAEETIEVGEMIAPTVDTIVQTDVAEGKHNDSKEDNNIDELLEKIKEEEETENIVQDLLQKSEQDLDDIIEKNTDALPLNEVSVNVPITAQTHPQTIDEEEDALLSTGEISEKARKQVELELQRQLEHPEESTENTTDTANLTAIITQEVREIIQHDIQKDLKKLKKKQVKEVAKEEDLINKSIEKPTELMQNLQEKVENHKQAMGIADDITTNTPLDTPYINDTDIDQELLLQLQGKVNTYKQTTENTDNSWDNSRNVDASEASDSVESLLDEFEAYKKKKDKFSTVSEPINNPSTEELSEQTNNEAQQVQEESTLESIKDMFSSKFEELKETVVEKTEQLSDKIEQIKDNFDDDAETTPVVEQQPEVQAEKSTLKSIKDMFSSKFEELKETVSEKTEHLSDKIEQIKDNFDDDAETTPVVEQQPEVQAEKSTLESIKDMFSSKFEELKETVAEKTEQLSDKIDELRHKADEQDNAVKTTESTHSELSVTREGVVLSEMMAKVYVRQGQYNKAIQIYEQLSLEYPEKSAYFAAKIQSLQK